MEIFGFKVSFKQIVPVLLGVVLLTSLGNIIEININGYYKVKQGITGEVTVINETGPFMQMFGSIFTYTNTSTLEYSVKDIRFNDGSVAKHITGTVQVKMPVKPEDQLKLHKDYRGFDNVMNGLVEKLIYASMKQTASLMKAEQFYSTRREEFRSLSETQIKEGIFETFINHKISDDEVKVQIRYDSKGRPVISAKSLLSEYGIEINQLLIDEVAFDEVTEGLIAKRKEAEKAKQDRITAEEQGKAKVASAEADKLVEKIQAVTDAQKAFEVAQLDRKKAEQDAQALLVKGKAQAEADRLKVIAGLTPLERAEIEMKTKIGVAEQMKEFKMPEVVIIGGKDGGKADPFDALGLKALRELVNQEQR